MTKSKVEMLAAAKINLALAVSGRRADGYHEIQTVFQSVSLYDRVRVELKGQGINCLCGELSGEQNIAYKAAKIFLEEIKKKKAQENKQGIQIHIDKNIPLQAGLAGGSSDAAAVLRALNSLYDKPFSYPELLAIAGKCGSDTAFCLAGGTQWGEGTGTSLQELPPVPDLQLIIVKPDKGVDTARAYRLFDESEEFSNLDRELWEKTLINGRIEEIGSMLFNSLEPVASKLVPEIKVLKDILLAEGCYGALMSGSGSAVFGIVRSREHGVRITEKLRKQGFKNSWLVKTKEKVL